MAVGFPSRDPPAARLHGACMRQALNGLIHLFTASNHLHCPQTDLDIRDLSWQACSMSSVLISPLILARDAPTLFMPPMPALYKRNPKLNREVRRSLTQAFASFSG